jgi:hypothetical protein
MPFERRDRDLDPWLTTLKQSCLQYLDYWGLGHFYSEELGPLARADLVMEIFDDAQFHELALTAEMLRTISPRPLLRRGSCADMRCPMPLQLPNQQLPVRADHAFLHRSQRGRTGVLRVGQRSQLYREYV